MVRGVNRNGVSMRIFLLLFIMLLFGGKTVSYAAATDGVLDLRNFDFREKGFASLDGDWDFYWQCFVPPDSLGKYEKVKEVVHVPLGWAGYKLGSKPVRDFGFASYHLRILVSDTTVLYKLLIDRVHSAAVFWANGVRVGSLGNVGRTADAEIADVVHITDVFGHNIQPVNGVVDLVVWVSNFQVAGSSAGISRHIRIAPAGVALQEYARDKVLYSGMVGMMLLFAVYHLILFLYRRKEYSIL
ncbi:MAG: hypothetical protein RIS47_398, partial [Bacteroidota bacterium]